MSRLAFRSWLWFDRRNADDFRRSVRWMRWLRAGGSLLLLVGCSGEASPAPALSCDGASNGERLVVVCNAPVLPVPDACERVADATYECNWLHANAEQCAAFPGICQ